jgi:uncharacterized protein (TIGR02001 family)
MPRHGVFNANPDQSTVRSRPPRLRWCGALLFLSCASRVLAAGTFGGSVDVTSDYLVRGISRTDQEAALQLDLHYSHSSGLFAGVFASNSRIDPYEPRDMELSAFVGFAFHPNDDWRARALYTHYAYPFNHGGPEYDYDELNLELAYQSWLEFSVVYSPNSPRYVPAPYRELYGVSEQAAEVNLQHPVYRTLSLTGGVGYAYLHGPEPRGYVYYSAGAAYDIGAFSLSLSYVDTSAGAKALFYNEAASHRVVGTVIWRF